MKLKPTAIEISSWPPCREIIYQCTKCKQDFRTFGERQRFCHICGTEVDWDGILLRLPKSFNKDDLDGERKLIKKINKQQLG